MEERWRRDVLGDGVRIQGFRGRTIRPSPVDNADNADNAELPPTG